MKTMTNGSQENWSAERIKELTMHRIISKEPIHARVHHPVMALVALIVIIIAMSVTAFAANAFGIRDFVGNFFNWNIDKASGVLELNTDGAATMQRWTEDGTLEYTMNLKSMTLSPTELTFSYAFETKIGETPLPGLLSVRMSDGSTINAEITATSIAGDLLTGSASFSSVVNLDEAVVVMFGGPVGTEGSAGIAIPVNSDIPRHPLPAENGAEYSITVSPQD